MANKYVFSGRTDGLGERLRALLNAMVLAKLLDVDFKFMWPFDSDGDTIAAVSPAGEIFDQVFIRKHLLSDLARAKYKRMKKEVHQLETLREMFNAHDAIKIEQNSLSNYIDTSALDIGGRFSRAFDRIGFSERLRSVIDMVRAIPLPEHAVAVHLRAGDIVFGKFRFSRRYPQKVISYPIAKRIVADLVARGKYPVIFGEDAATCRLLAEPLGVKLANELVGVRWQTPVEAAMADIILMSRCTEIYAGHSGFAIAASLVGNRPLMDQRRLLPASEIARTILNDRDLNSPASRLPALQRAFAYCTVVYLGEQASGAAEVDWALDQAVRYDPANLYYILLRAARHLAAGPGGSDDAERINRLAAESTWRENHDLRSTILYEVLAEKDVADYLAALRLTLLEGLAGAPRPYSHYLLALADQDAGNFAAAAAHLQASLAAEPENEIFSALSNLLAIVAPTI